MELELSLPTATACAAAACVSYLAYLGNGYYRRFQSSEKAASYRAECQIRLRKALANRTDIGISFESISEVMDAISSNHHTAQEVIDAAIYRTLTSNEHDNSVCDVIPLPDVASLSGPLRGVPFSVKECCHVAGCVASMGLTHLCQDVIQALGAVPIVTSNLPQTMLTTESSNPVYGRTLNPLAAARTPGGSSSGEAVIAARCGVPFGIGTDIGGSVRIPAHCCGVFGFKPTRHRLPIRGITTCTPGQQAISSTTGLLAPSAENIATVFKHVVDHVAANGCADGEVPPIPFNTAAFGDTRPLTIGIFTGEDYMPASTSCARAVDEAAAELRAKGHVVKLFSYNKTQQLVHLYFNLMSADGARTVLSFLDNDVEEETVTPLLRLVRVPKFVHTLARWVPNSRALALLGATGEKTVQEAWHLKSQMTAMMFDFQDEMKKQGVDALLTPASVLPAPQHGRCSEVVVSAWPTFIFNLLDFPAGIVPVTAVTAEDVAKDLASPPADIVEKRFRNIIEGSEGTPIGAQVVAPRWQEEVCLRLMSSLSALDPNGKAKSKQ